MNHEKCLTEAKTTYNQGMTRVKDTPEPNDQKFPINSRVKISDDLGQCMRFFPHGVNAIVCYTYAHAFGGNNVKSYCLDVDGHGKISWYDEHQLALINP